MPDLAFRPAQQAPRGSSLSETTPARASRGNAAGSIGISGCGPPPSGDGGKPVGRQAECSCKLPRRSLFVSKSLTELGMPVAVARRTVDAWTTARATRSAASPSNRVAFPMPCACIDVAYPVAGRASCRRKLRSPNMPPCARTACVSAAVFKLARRSAAGWEGGRRPLCALLSARLEQASRGSVRAAK